MDPSQTPPGASESPSTVQDGAVDVAVVDGGPCAACLMPAAGPGKRWITHPLRACELCGACTCSRCVNARKRADMYALKRMQLLQVALDEATQAALADANIVLGPQKERDE